MLNSRERQDTLRRAFSPTWKPVCLRMCIWYYSKMAVHHYSCDWTHVHLALRWNWTIQKGRSQTYWNCMTIFSMMMEIDLFLRPNLLGSPTVRPVVPSSRIRKCRPWRIRQQSHPKGLQYSLKVWLQKRLEVYRYNVAAAVCVGYEDKTEKYKPSLRYKPGMGSR